MVINIDLLLGILSKSLELAGAMIIAGGSAYVMWIFIAGLCGFGPRVAIDSMRVELGRIIVLAIEFLLAADIMYTIITPNYYEIGMLASMVVIRIILTFFLNQELNALRSTTRAI